MKRKHKVLDAIYILLLCVILLGVTWFAVSKHSLKKHEIVYANAENQLIYHSVAKQEGVPRTLNGYTNYYAIGTYSGGDYCLAVLDEQKNPRILLVKEGKVEQDFAVDFLPTELLADANDLYCLVQNTIYRVNLQTQQAEPYAENVYAEEYRRNMFLSQDGKLLYLTQGEDGEADTLVYQVGEEMQSLCEASYGRGFVSASEFVYIDSNRQNKIVNLDSKETKDTLKYRHLKGPILLTEKKHHIAAFYWDGLPNFRTQILIDKNNGVFVKTGLDDSDVPVSYVVLN